MQIFDTYIIELAVISALLSMFLDFCFREDNIFEGWLEFLYEQSVPGKVRECLASEDREDRFKHITWFWFKPLGGCVICMNVWISFALCACFYKRLPLELGVNGVIETLAGALLMVLLSSFIVRFFQEKIV